MDYKTAVQAALNGEEEGFLYLYETTYTKMFHKALFFVKNRSDAEDVLQDSYIKAERFLNTLDEPDKFPIWFSKIVETTSKNFIRKMNRKPITFFGLANDSQDKEVYNSEIVDEDNLFRPEESYSEKEIRIIFRELIDSLSDEQRICILMHHFDEQTVNEIADTMNCSVGTVKSRLFYGRKALRKKIEDMQEKGYNFYGAAPIPILKYFMEKDSMTSEFLKSADVSMESSKLTVLSKVDSVSNITTVSALKSTVGYKILAVCVAAAVVGGGMFVLGKYSDFNGFVKLLNINNEMIEDVNSVTVENNKDSNSSNINDNTIFNTDISSDIMEITDTKDADNTVRNISADYSKPESKASNKPAGLVSQSPTENSQAADSDKSTEDSRIVTVTEYVQIPQSTENGSQNSSVSDLGEKEKYSVEKIYSEVLDSLAELETEDNKYVYYLADLDNDGTIELITINYVNEPFNYEDIDDDAITQLNDGDKIIGDNRIKYIIEAYTFEENNSSYELKKLDGKFQSSYLYLYSFSFSEELANLKNNMATWQYDDNLYFIFDSLNVYKLRKSGDKFEGWYYFSDDYYDDITLFDIHSLYQISDKTPLNNLNK